MPDNPTSIDKNLPAVSPEKARPEEISSISPEQPSNNVNASGKVSEPKNITSLAGAEGGHVVDKRTGVEVIKDVPAEAAPETRKADEEERNFIEEVEEQGGHS